MKTLILKQPAGLGDILFLQKIAKIHISEGYRVIWPVADTYKWIGKYIPNIEFPSIDAEFDFKNQYDVPICSIKNVTDDLKIICTDGCGNGTEIMKSKYELVGVAWEDWQDYLIFDRNSSKEAELCKLLNPDNEPYYIVSSCMGTPPNHLNRIKIPVCSDLKRIELDFIAGYTLFDWCMMLEKAQEIYIEGSAITYICEKLNLSANKMELFSRDGHMHFGDLFKKSWNARYDQINN